MILSWIYSALIPKIVGQIISYQTSHAAWYALEKIFSASSKARVMQLRLEFQTTRKGSLPMMEYILKLKNLADSLAVIGEPVSDRDQILQLLGGLGANYNSIVATPQHHKYNKKEHFNRNTSIYNRNNFGFNPGRGLNGGRSQGSHNNRP